MSHVDVNIDADESDYTIIATLNTARLAFRESWSLIYAQRNAEREREREREYVREKERRREK